MAGAVLLERRDDVAYVTLNAPPLNILTCAVMDELSGVLEEVSADAALKAVALRANGKAFSAGADVGEHEPERAPALIASFSRLFRTLGAMEIPIVMAVDGAALGAGFELVQLADVLVASERAKFGQPEIRLAFFAPVGVAWLPALVGTAKAMEITCTGRTYSAEEMRACGLVAKVVPPDALADAVEVYLDDFRKASPAILRLNVRTLKRLRGLPFEEARLEAEKVFIEELMTTEDVREGIASFAQRRPAVWKNR
jgi:cyclohexa-1,5-dienecarbonyl-CoA hydratase